MTSVNDADAPGAATGGASSKGSAAKAGASSKTKAVKKDTSKKSSSSKADSPTKSTNSKKSDSPSNKSAKVGSAKIDASAQAESGKTESTKADVSSKAKLSKPKVYSDASSVTEVKAGNDQNASKAGAVKSATPAKAKSGKVNDAIKASSADDLPGKVKSEKAVELSKKGSHKNDSLAKTKLAKLADSSKVNSAKTDMAKKVKSGKAADASTKTDAEVKVKVSKTVDTAKSDGQAKTTVAKAEQVESDGPSNEGVKSGGKAKATVAKAEPVKSDKPSKTQGAKTDGKAKSTVAKTEAVTSDELSKTEGAKSDGKAKATVVKAEAVKSDGPSKTEGAKSDGKAKATVAKAVQVETDRPSKSEDAKSDGKAKSTVAKTEAVKSDGLSETEGAKSGGKAKSTAAKAAPVKSEGLLKTGDAKSDGKAKATVAKAESLKSDGPLKSEGAKSDGKEIAVVKAGPRKSEGLAKTDNGGSDGPAKAASSTNADGASRAEASPTNGSPQSDTTAKQVDQDSSNIVASIKEALEKVEAEPETTTNAERDLGPDEVQDTHANKLVIDSEKYVFKTPAAFRAPKDDYSNFDIYGPPPPQEKLESKAKPSNQKTAMDLRRQPQSASPAKDSTGTHKAVAKSGPKKGSATNEPLLVDKDDLTPAFNNIRNQPMINSIHAFWFRIFGFLDVRSIVTWSMTCRKSCLQVHCGVLQLLHPLIRTTDISTDLRLWKYTIEKLLLHRGVLAPMRRQTYKPLIKELSKNLKLGPVSIEQQGKSSIYLTFDDLPAKYIMFATSDQPQKHRTSLKNNSLMGSSIYCQGLTLGEFIMELKKHIITEESADLFNKRVAESGAGYRNEPLRHFGESVAVKFDNKGDTTFRGQTESSSLLCLHHFLKGILRCCLGKERGKVIFRRLELVKNSMINLEHRVWLQCLLGWPEIPGQKAPTRSTNAFEDNIREYEHQLFLTVCDHYHWFM